MDDREADALLSFLFAVTARLSFFASNNFCYQPKRKKMKKPFPRDMMPYPWPGLHFLASRNHDELWAPRYMWVFYERRLQIDLHV